jgi:hypothetical protein
VSFLDWTSRSRHCERTADPSTARPLAATTAAKRQRRGRYAQDDNSFANSVEPGPYCLAGKFNLTRRRNQAESNRIVGQFRFEPDPLTQIALVPSMTGQPATFLPSNTRRSFAQWLGRRSWDIDPRWRNRTFPNSREDEPSNNLPTQELCTPKRLCCNAVPGTASPGRPSPVESLMTPLFVAEFFTVMADLSCAIAEIPTKKTRRKIAFLIWCNLLFLRSEAALGGGRAIWSRPICTAGGPKRWSRPQLIFRFPKPGVCDG